MEPSKSQQILKTRFYKKRNSFYIFVRALGYHLPPSHTRGIYLWHEVFFKEYSLLSHYGAFKAFLLGQIYWQKIKSRNSSLGSLCLRLKYLPWACVCLHPLRLGIHMPRGEYIRLCFCPWRCSMLIIMYR